MRSKIIQNSEELRFVPGKISRTLAVFLLIMISSVPALAGENSYSACSYIPEAITDWDGYHTLPQFDTSLGILTKVEINATSNLSQDYCS